MEGFNTQPFELPEPLKECLKHVKQDFSYCFLRNEKTGNLGDMKPLAECIASERMRVNENVQKLLDAKDGEEIYPGPTILEVLFKMDADASVIEGVVDIYMTEFPALVKGFAALHLRPIWRVAIEYGHAPAFTMLWFKQLTAKGPECMTYAAAFAPDLQIPTSLVRLAVPVTTSNTAELKRRGLDKQEASWAEFREALRIQDAKRLKNWVHG
ncbi:hypothetical protein F5Y04DRAFT_287383 [Hypomontagnella monticulosa]|nr:hypothetical protein F5Y04DRAFT_287383 [Hypomontagnella monticulosa]